MPGPGEAKGQLELLLLSVIAEGEQHGYAIIRNLHDRSNGRFEMKEGTVYPALHRLEEAGLVASREVEVEGRKRRLYTITGAGQASLAERRAAWFDFSAGIAAVLGTNP